MRKSAVVRCSQFSSERTIIPYKTSNYLENRQIAIYYYRHSILKLSFFEAFCIFVQFYFVQKLVSVNCRCLRSNVSICAFDCVFAVRFALTYANANVLVDDK